MPVLLDTSFLFALSDTSDRHHQQVLAVAQTIAEPLLLAVPVLPEICYLLASRPGHGAMRRFLAELSVSDVMWETLEKNDLVRINELLSQYADASLDFTDAALVAIAERRNVKRILTLDRRDFTLVRPRHCSHFEILP